LPFEVVEASDSAVSLLLASSDATRPGYPYSFDFTVTYRLVTDGLETTLATRNTGDQPLPYYAGHHFYFALPHAQRAESRLSMPPSARAAAEMRRRAGWSGDADGRTSVFSIPRESACTRSAIRGSSSVLKRWAGIECTGGGLLWWQWLPLCSNSSHAGTADLNDRCIARTFGQ